MANLDDLQRQVLHDGGTEAPFTGEYWNHHEDGGYHCVSCGQKLFESNVKLDSSKGPGGLQGWPAFADVIEGSVEYKDDESMGMRRAEVVCKGCGGHLGHLFDDSETETNKHYCINSCTLSFKGVDQE